MRIVIDSQAANDTASYRWLDRILSRIEDGWHVWDTTDDEDTAAVLATNMDKRPRDSRRVGAFDVGCGNSA